MSELLSINFSVSSFCVVCLFRDVCVLHRCELCFKWGQYMNIFSYRSFILQIAGFSLNKERQEPSAGKMESWSPDLSRSHTSDLEEATSLTLQGLGFFTWEQGSKQLFLPRVFFLSNLIFLPLCICLILSVVLCEIQVSPSWNPSSTQETSPVVQRCWNVSTERGRHCLTRQQCAGCGLSDTWGLNQWLSHSGLLKACGNR